MMGSGYQVPSCPIEASAAGGCRPKDIHAGGEATCVTFGVIVHFLRRLPRYNAEHGGPGTGAGLQSQL